MSARAKSNRTAPLTGSMSTGSLTNTAVRVGERLFNRLRVLGMGASGIVWEVTEATVATGHSHGTLALKYTSPSSRKMLEACLLEVELLKEVATVLPVELRSGNRVPQYVTHALAPAPTRALPGAILPPTPRADGQQPRVLLVMTKLHGKSLDQWLYGIDENRMKTVSMTELLDGPLPGGQLASRDVVSAAATATVLLTQLAPVFAAISRLAFHRDVSAHNFLVRHNPSGEEEFALLDFGLAVRSHSWQAEFKSRDISGDPRYFSPAAWMLMVYGNKYLLEHPNKSFLEQYKHRLDHYSFGVLVLEVFFALWKGPEAEAKGGLAAGEVNALSMARAAWRSFWTEAMGLFQMYHRQGAAATRQGMAHSQATSRYAQKLHGLCTALRQAREQQPSSAFAKIFEAAADLIDPCGTRSWHDLLRVVQPVEAMATTEKPGSKEEDAVESRSAPRFNLGRSWTVDEAVSLARAVASASVGWADNSLPWQVSTRDVKGFRL